MFRRPFRIEEERADRVARPREPADVRIHDARELQARVEDVLIGCTLGPKAATHGRRSLRIDAHHADGVETAIEAVHVLPAEEARKEMKDAARARAWRRLRGLNRQGEPERQQRAEPQSIPNGYTCH